MTEIVEVGKIVLLGKTFQSTPVKVASIQGQDHEGLWKSWKTLLDTVSSSETMTGAVCQLCLFG